MPIIRSAKKAHEASLRKHVFNVRCTRTMKASIKEIKDLAADGKYAEAEKKVPEAYKAIDKAKKRGILKASTANRKKANIAKTVVKVEKKEEEKKVKKVKKEKTAKK